LALPITIATVATSLALVWHLGSSHRTVRAVQAHPLAHGSKGLESGSIFLDDSDGRDWAAYGRTFGEQHYSPLTQINVDSINRLGLVWARDLGPGNSASIPLAVDGTLYFTTGYSIIRAVDAATGRELWQYDSEAAAAAGQKLRGSWGSRGIAYWDGKIFAGTVDGRLIAIDARTGTLVWSVMTVGKDDGRYITGAPRVFDGMVIIGHGGADVANVRGYVTTYDARTGKPLWRFYTVPGRPADGFENAAMEMAARTWAGAWWRYGGGGTVWNAITFDADTDTIYIGVGNGSPWNHRIRSLGKGNNLFLSSIVALDARTGTYKWHYQTNPGESWDYNASMDMVLSDQRINGVFRKLLITAPKNGFLYVIDRLTGKLISAEAYVKVNWARGIDLNTGRPIENPGIRYDNGKTVTMWPGPVGAHSWQPTAFDAQRAIIYIPAIEMAAAYNDRGIASGNWHRKKGGQIDGGANVNPLLNLPPPNGTSALIAWDVIHQKQVWKQPTPGFWNGGLMATAGNLVFQGQIDGQFNAYSADDGKREWSFAAQAPIIAAPITFMAGGKQYVTVLTGMGTSGAVYGPLIEKFGIDARSQARRVLTFALDGTARLPRRDEASSPIVDDPSIMIDPKQSKYGRVVYNGHCAVCHGIAAISGGYAPDLRKSPVSLSRDAFTSVVRDGALLDAGMPRFGELTEHDLDGLRQFIRSRARADRKRTAGAR
jgi:quinohemoprotein ethanol dehydrogenase